MRFRTDRHASDEVLEQYSMGRLEEPASQLLEEHLLICERCQDNLAATDVFCRSMRSAGRDLRRQADVPQAKTGLRWPFELPKPIWAIGAAALVLLVAAGSRWPALRGSVAQPATVLLESNRGPQSPLSSSAPAARPFTLLLDLTDLQVLPQYRLEIVGADGHAVFGSSATPSHNKLRATITKGLPGGTYFVRVYGHELLREYELEARN